MHHIWFLLEFLFRQRKPACHMIILSKHALLILSLIFLEIWHVICVVYCLLVETWWQSKTCRSLVFVKWRKLILLKRETGKMTTKQILHPGTRQYYLDFLNLQTFVAINVAFQRPFAEMNLYTQQIEFLKSLEFCNRIHPALWVFSA